MIAFITTYLIYAMAAGYVAVWLFAEDRNGKLYLGFSAVAGLILTLVLIKLTGALYDNPRPFVEDPTIVPLIDHEPDNGFPSNHAAAAGLIAMVVALRHRWWGLLLAVAAAVVAWSRVAAHVHHLLDVVAALAIGSVAGILGTLIVTMILNRTRFKEQTAARHAIS